MLLLRQKGFTKLSALRGGYADWQYLGGATERGADTTPRTVNAASQPATTTAPTTPQTTPNVQPSFTPTTPKKGAPGKSRTRTRRPTRTNGR